MKDILPEIENNKNKLKKLLKNPNNKNVLYNWLKSELAYTSNAIEGNTLTRKETALVIEENITSSSKPFVYYQEAVNHAKAFNKMLEILENNLPVNENAVLNLHKIILTGIDDLNAGFYRNCMVRISGSRVILPNPMKVPDLIQEFFEWLNSSDITNPLTAIEAHYKLVSIHPFTDGNGRCARLLMNMLLLKANYSPIIIRPIDRKRYLDNLEKSQLSNNLTSYTMFMLSALERSLKTNIDVLEVPRKNIEPKKLLTISKFAKLVGVPTSTIRYWVQIGKLKPISYTNSGYMQFDKEQIPDCAVNLNK